MPSSYMHQVWKNAVHVVNTLCLMDPDDHPYLNGAEAGPT